MPSENRNVGRGSCPIIRVSPSIVNWESKILKRYNASLFVWWRDLWKPVWFFGLYRPSDYLWFILHRGEKTVVWCGSDIFQGGWMIRAIRNISSRHICENRVEWGALLMLLGKPPEIQHLFFGDVTNYPISFTPSKRPHVYLFSHVGGGAEIQSGIGAIEHISTKVPEVTFHVYGIRRRNLSNVIYHGYVPESKLDDEIRNYHAGIRLHHFDGFSEVLAKSILLGQYPISTIYYPDIDNVQNIKQLIVKLRNLKKMKNPNPKSELWRKKLSDPL